VFQANNKSTAARQNRVRFRPFAATLADSQVLSVPETTMSSSISIAVINIISINIDVTPLLT